MTNQPPAPNRPVSSHLHRLIYRVMVGLGLWLAVSVWGFSANGGYAGLALTVASLFIVIAIMLPLILSRIARRRPRDPASPAEDASFTQWLGSDLETRWGHLKAKDAAVEILLPIVAAALGMTLFAIILHFDVGA